MAQHSNATHPSRPLTIAQVAEAVRLYPPEAYDFVQHGLHYTVEHEFGTGVVLQGGRHVTGRQLCEGLRAFALAQWGLMARAVLAKWNIHSTYDFGLIVFAMVEGGILKKTDKDELSDFRFVYDFADFDRVYCVKSKL